MEFKRLSGSREHSAKPRGIAEAGRDSGQMDFLATLGAHSAGLAHELKNALVPVKTMMQLLLHRHPDAELGEMANRELARIDSLLSQMMLMATPAPPRQQEVRMHELLNYTLRLLRNELEGKTIQLKQSRTARSDRVKGNEYQLQQAIMNLLLNAIDSMEAGGTLTVTTRNLAGGGAGPLSAGSGQLCVEIGDTGSGIAPDNLARLFEPFFTTKRGGTGLGLHITQRICNDHQGTISVESAVGKGTKFSILLPLEQGV